MTDLTKLIDRIRDARRHVNNWELAEQVCRPLVNELWHEGEQLSGDESPEWILGRCVGVTLVRCAKNIRAGLEHVITSPSVLGGYLAGAEIELMALAERLAKSEDDK